MYIHVHHEKTAANDQAIMQVKHQIPLIRSGFEVIYKIIMMQK